MWTLGATSRSCFPAAARVANSKKPWSKKPNPEPGFPTSPPSGSGAPEQLGLTVPSKMELLVELQHVAEGMRVTHALPEWGSFDRFQPWGMAAMADFNAVDHHLLEARQVFRDLRNIKDIEAWSFGRPDLTAGQQAFLAQWNTLHPLHTAFHEHLQSHGSCTSGMLARKMATEEGALRHVSDPCGWRVPMPSHPLNTKPWTV